ncbi:MAG: sigma-70 family RNA polymerase sigma factor [Myxococcota bacterium]
MPPVVEHAAFPATRWSMVARASHDDERAHVALGELCTRYWAPLYAFVRHQGRSASDAEDLVQGFVAEVLNTKGLARADQQRGRFRNYLLGAFRHYLSKQSRRERTQKRGGGQAPRPLDFEGADGLVELPVAGPHDPEAAYARTWAMATLRRAMSLVAREYEERGLRPIFDALEPSLLNGETPPYREIAERQDMNEGAVRVAAHRLRTRFRQMLRDEVADTLVEGADVGAELRALMDALRPSEP